MNWRRWLKAERLIPSATILLAFIAQALALFGVVQLSIGENIILGLLTLLAIDALTERLTVLEQLREEIRTAVHRRPRMSDFLQTRTQAPPLDQRFAMAQSIDIAGMSLLAVSTSHHELLAKKARNGCQIRLLLLNPNDENLMKFTSVFVASLTPEAHRQEIITSLNTLTGDKDLFTSKNVQIRLYDYPLSHGILITNGDTNEGEMRVETFLYRKRPNRTPGFFIRKAEDQELFDAFMSEFNEVWANATPYST